MATGRSVDARGNKANYAYGIDGTFGFFDNLTINTYWARTGTEGLSGDDISYQTQLDYSGDRYGLQVDRLVIGDNFNPEIGFVRRDNMRRTFGSVRFSPRPAGLEAIRKLSWTASVNYIENQTGVLETRERIGAFGIDLENSDTFSLTYTNSYEFLSTPFKIARGVILPVGGYDFDEVQASYSLARQRPVRAVLSLSRGTFYGGHKTAFGATGGRVRLTDQISMEPTYSLNRVSLREGDFTTHLLGTRATYTITPQMFVSALTQYTSNTNSVSTNARLRWEYQPGSELFVVYSEQRDTLAQRFPDMMNRAFIVKFNRLFRF
jgi:hypothetical protein